MIPSNQLFHCPTAVNKTIVAIEGIESGIYILNKMVNGGLFATYFLYKQLGLLNSFLIYVLPGACDVWFVLMLKVSTV